MAELHIQLLQSAAAIRNLQYFLFFFFKEVEEEKYFTPVYLHVFVYVSVHRVFECMDV